MNFTMNAKELRTMIDKAASATMKKSCIPGLSRVYLEVDSDGTVKAFGTDIDHFVEARSDSAKNTVPGMIGIELPDMKVISKANGDITLTENEDYTTVKMGKKVVGIPLYTEKVISMPDVESKRHIMTAKESWLLDTIKNLSVFSSHNEEDSRPMFHFFNFNTSEFRIEAIDGCRIAYRDLPSEYVKMMGENVLLHNKCVPVFKKLMKYYENDINIYQNEKYISIEGCDFTYVIRRKADLQFFDIKYYVNCDIGFSFNVDRGNILSVIKYANDLNKNKLPIIFHCENDNLYTYLKTSDYKILDDVDIENHYGINFDIGFNTRFLVDALDVIDSDYVSCRGIEDSKALLFDGKEYHFVILPVHPGTIPTETIDEMNDYIRKHKAS